jgi:hypothetical protein
VSGDGRRSWFGGRDEAVEAAEAMAAWIMGSLSRTSGSTRSCCEGWKGHARMGQTGKAGDRSRAVAVASTPKFPDVVGEPR